MDNQIYKFECETLSGEPVSLQKYAGKLLLIVNTASKCGLTPQYEGLEELYKKYADKGLEILGFPCNQFGKQEPGDASDISEFCEINYGVSFPMFAKIEVNGSGTHPLYQHLKNEAPGLMGSKNIKWNFTKFLVDQEGQVLKRFSPTTKPEDIENEISKYLERI